jgi:hypothetical protein
MVHLTPASLACPQLWFKSYEQLKSAGSFPVHMILFATMGPVPWPYAAAYIGTAAVSTQSYKFTPLYTICKIEPHLILSSPAVDKQPLLLHFPRSCHKWSPTGCKSRSQCVLPEDWHLQPASHHHCCR